MFKKLNKKGFTLAELLVVVAIIGVLVAISIPIFTSQLEKSRDAVTLSNIRAAYAEASSAKLTGAGDGANVVYNSDGTVTVDKIVVKGEQTNGGFNATELPFTLKDDTIKNALDNSSNGKTVKVKFSWGSDGKCSAEKVN